MRGPIKTLMIAMLLAAAAPLAGCEDRDGFEKAGEDIDEALEEAGDAIEDAGDEIEDATDPDGTGGS